MLLKSWLEPNKSLPSLVRRPGGQGPGKAARRRRDGRAPGSKLRGGAGGDAGSQDEWNRSLPLEPPLLEGRRPTLTGLPVKASSEDNTQNKCKYTQYINAKCMVQPAPAVPRDFFFLQESDVMTPFYHQLFFKSIFKML